MGTFHFDEASLESPFVRLLENSPLLFNFPALRHGERHDWTFFWTCNISLPTAALLEVGGFDEENFHKAIGEDVELGIRLQKRGYGVVYREDCVAHHHHELTPASYMRRAVDLGVHQLKIEGIHGIQGLAWSQDPAQRAREKETLGTLETEREGRERPGRARGVRHGVSRAPRPRRAPREAPGRYAAGHVHLPAGRPSPR